MPLGVPRAIADWRLRNEIDVARDRGVVDNDDGSISVPTDDELARPYDDRVGRGHLVGAYREQLMPSPQYDRGVSVIKNTWVKPGDRVDRDRATGYPGPFNPRTALDKAIEYVFQFSDSVLRWLCERRGSHPAFVHRRLDRPDHPLRLCSGASPKRAIVKQLGERVQAIADGYTLLIWDEIAA